MNRVCVSQCCDDTANLATVPKASVNGKAPYTSVVQIISKLYVDDYYYGTGGCSGTVSQRADIILTAGHCFEVWGVDFWCWLTIELQFSSS